MTDQWHFHSETFGTCNCAANCGCQFQLPSTHGSCQFVEGGKLIDSHFNDVSLSGLKWGMVMIWPGEIAEGNGKRLLIVDEKANDAQREAMEKILSGQAGGPGSSHFSVFDSTCSESLETQYLPIEYKIDISDRTAKLVVPGLINATGEPIIDAFSGEPFRIGLSRPTGSFEFTHAEIGHGTSKVQGDMALAMEGTYAQFNEHIYNQDGLAGAA
jgi:hypothetical protein